MSSAAAAGGPADCKYDLAERIDDGFLVLSSPQRRPGRRIVFVNSHGGPATWIKIKEGAVPPQHLWGCIELAQMGYEVALVDPLPHFYLYRRPLPHDLKLLKLVREWLGCDGIIYCGHTLLYWLPLLKRLGAIKCPIVSLTYAREELDFAGAHTGIIALTPAAADQARKIAPRAKVAHLGWGVDLSFYPKLPYNPSWFLSCGITHRDQTTLRAAAWQSSRRLRVIGTALPSELQWPSHVDIFDGGSGINTEKSAVPYRDLIYTHYAGAAASLIVLNEDPIEYTAVGVTNLIEAMGLGRPVIATRTGALPSELDVEKAGCGLHVPPRDPRALAQAIESIASNPERARVMGEAGRALCETHYNTVRFAADLHRFFETF